ncbi:DUF4955 domain-containing protein [Niabella hirudinis]|uniref:DUF4955 domain-containing protein n=1 Tax=Niabella hirudinis TaxID=1285929 RepID=UPI003EBF604C
MSTVIKLHLCVLLLGCIQQASAQLTPSVLFEQYRSNKKKSLLPDFSYVGYHCGETDIPQVKDSKVFNVVDFGAKADDQVSDRDAIQAAITAANINGSGIVFFPKGRFLVNEDGDLKKPIISKGGNIVFRGSGSGPGGTELFMKNFLPPANPEQMWTTPQMFLFTAKGADVKIGVVTKDAKMGTFDLRLNTTAKLEEGDWIALKLLDNSPKLVEAELEPHQADTSWAYLIKKGVDICMYYQVKEISNTGFVTLYAPLAYAIDAKYKWEVYKHAHAEEVGIEDIAFVGSWKEKFIHHRSWKDDSGYSLLNLSRSTNSWIRNCRFTDCNVAAVITQSANVTVMNCTVTGNAGHEAICSNHSTNVLLANLTDEASQWHSFGMSHGAVNTVLWHCSYPSTTCFESHASQPRNTLLDNVMGGLMSNRGGGAIENMPNHLKGLVFWNYTQTNEAKKDFQFWPANDIWWKIPNPLIAGYKSKGTTFKKEQLGYLEGLNEIVTPASLYEAQLQLRLKRLPGWLVQLKKGN